MSKKRMEIEEKIPGFDREEVKAHIYLYEKKVKRLVSELAHYEKLLDLLYERETEVKKQHGRKD